MRLDQTLLDRQLAPSRSRAQAMIKAGCVRVNGEVASKSSMNVTLDAMIEVEPDHPWVSRAGLKLAHALEAWNIHVSGKECLDLGSSTGGFTQLLLEAGASHVTAVDVGTDQLHATLRGHPCLTLLEQTDARTLTAAHLPKAPTLITCDVSFISVTKLLSAPLALAAQQAELIVLIKPQFELPPSIPRKNGVIKDEYLRQQAVTLVTEWMETHHPEWKFHAVTLSPVTGGSGNKEFLSHWVRSE